MIYWQLALYSRPKTLCARTSGVERDCGGILARCSGGGHDGVQCSAVQHNRAE